MKHWSRVILIVLMLLPFPLSAQWVQTDGLTGGLVYSIVSTSSVLVASVEYTGIYRSTNDGASWSFSHTGIPVGNVWTLQVDSTNFYAGTSGRGVYRSSDGGLTWAARNTGMPSASVYGIAFQGPLMIAATASGIYISTNRGTSWNASDSGLTTLNLRSVVFKGSRLFSGGASGTVFVSTNNGATWALSKTGITTTTNIKSLYVDDTRLFAGSGNGVYRSTDDGASWTSIGNSTAGTNGYVWLRDEGALLLGTSVNFSRSTDNGTTWVTSAAGLTNKAVMCLWKKGSILFAGTSGHGIYRSTDGGLNWTHSSRGITNGRITELLGTPTSVIAGSDGAGCQVSTNGGRNWEIMGTGFNYPFVRGFASSGNLLFATCSDGVYRYNAISRTWTRSGFNFYPFPIVLAGTTLYAGTPTGMAVSKDSNGTWTGPLSSIGAKYVTALKASPTHVFAGTEGGGIYRTTVGDTMWTPINNGLTDLNVYGLAVMGSAIYAGTGTQGVFKSTNNGDSWSQAINGMPATYIRTFCVSGNALFAGAWVGGVYVTQDGAASWTPVNDGFDFNPVSGLAVSDGVLYLGSYYSGVWKRNLSQMITSVESEPLPPAFVLDQNYPNPFNPATLIRFQIAAAGHVRLTVFDLLGREVALPVNERKDPGSYTVRFEAGDLPNGVYLYRLEAQGRTATRKMTLVR